MAAPVRIEAEAFTDPRFGALGRLRRTSRWEALGRMAVLWSWCTERGRGDIPRRFASGFFEDPGWDGEDWIHDVIAAGLGRWGPCTETDLHGPECEHLVLHGTGGRIEWFGESKASQRAAGIARARNAVRDARGRLLPSSRLDSSDDQRPSSDLAPASPALSSALSPDQDQISASEISGSDHDRSAERELMPAPPALPRSRKGRSKKPPAGSPTAAELVSVKQVLDRLAKRAAMPRGFDLNPASENVKVVTRALRTLTDRGRTLDQAELELRYIVAYCAIKLGWQDDEKMRDHLNPGCLFGPKKLDHYLDRAIAWVEDGEAEKDHAARKAARAEIPDNVVPLPLQREG